MEKKNVIGQKVRAQVQKEPKPKKPKTVYATGKISGYIKSGKILPIRQGWEIGRGWEAVACPNLYVRSTNNILLWETLGFDIDSQRSQSQPYMTIDKNPNNGHLHVFVNLKEGVSYEGLKYLIENQSSSIEATIASYLEPVAQWAKVHDLFLSKIHKELARVLNADPATSTHINHPFRMPRLGIGRKFYVRVKHAEKSVDIFQLAKELDLDPIELLRALVEELVDEKSHNSCFFHIKREYEIHCLNNRLRAFELCKFIAERFWVKGHRQNLSMIITGVLYRHFKEDVEKVRQALESIIPQDDEERKKRFDPLKYIVNRTTYYGIPTLKLYLKNHFNYKLDLSQFVEDSDSSDIVIVKPKRLSEKRPTSYEVKQIIAVTLLALTLRNDVCTYDAESQEFVFKFNTIKEFHSFLNAFKGGKTPLSHRAISMHLEEFEKAGLISVEKELYTDMTTYTTYKRLTIRMPFEVYSMLRQSLAWNATQKHFTIYALGKILNEGKVHEKIEGRVVKDECFKMLFIYTLREGDKDLVKEALDVLSDKLQAYYEEHNIKDVVDNVRSFIFANAVSCWKSRDYILKLMHLPKGIKPMSKQHRYKLLYKLWFMQIDSVAFIVDVIRSLIQPINAYSRPIAA